MVGMTRDWIVRQLSLGEFDSPRHVWRQAIVMACKIAALAYGINLFLHFLMFQFDLLPYTLKAGLIAATVITPTIAFSVALVVYAVLGFAIYDLGTSRTELEHLSRTDMLSGLANRRAFQDAFDQCDADKTMAVFDIDRFKSINDNHGHSVGDLAIVRVGTMLQTVFGNRCLCARIGGEEFAVFNSEMPFADFAALAELARIRISTMRIDTDAGGFCLTVSGGVARALPEQEFGETFSRADTALYAAKTGGRNRIVLSHDTANEAGQTEPSDAASAA